VSGASVRTGSKIAGIVLAAGASSRMGSPKALLGYKGETFAGRLIRVLSRACDPVVIVLGYHADAIRPSLEGRARIVLNPSPERGQLSSLQTALAALPAGTEAFMFTPVDCPAIAEETVDCIAAGLQARASGTMLVIPSYRGRHGHPVGAVRMIADELLGLPPEGQARQVIHRHIAETRYIEVDDAGILTDIDDPESYRRLAEPGAGAGHAGTAGCER
jgi:molybdenum cofactor cytidylyltransferase